MHQRRRSLEAQAGARGPLRIVPGGAEGVSAPLPAVHAWFARADLSPVPVGMRRSTVPVAMAVAQRALAERAKPVGKRATRIPADALIGIGGPANRPLLLAAPSASPATVVEAAPAVSSAPPRWRRIAREAALFAMFLLTLAGVFYVGQIYASHKIIVVPETTSYRNVIT